MVYLVIAGLVALGIAVGGAMWLMSGQPAHRRMIIQRTAVLALAAFLLVGAIFRHENRWINVAVGVFMVGALLFDGLWKRRRQRVVSSEVRPPSARH